MTEHVLEKLEINAGAALDFDDTTVVVPMTLVRELVGDLLNEYKALSAEEPKTGPEHGEQVMVSTEEGTFRCDCKCNVFTRIGESSSFLCNACRATWHGEPYTPFVNANTPEDTP